MINSPTDLAIRGRMPNSSPHILGRLSVICMHRVCKNGGLRRAQLLARSDVMVGPWLMTSPKTSRSVGKSWLKPSGKPANASPPPGPL